MAAAGTGLQSEARCVDELSPGCHVVDFARPRDRHMLASRRGLLTLELGNRRLFECIQQFRFDAYPPTVLVVDTLFFLIVRP